MDLASVLEELGEASPVKNADAPQLSSHVVSILHVDGSSYFNRGFSCNKVNDALWMSVTCAGAVLCATAVRSWAERRSREFRPFHVARMARAWSYRTCRAHKMHISCHRFG